MILDQTMMRRLFTIILAAVLSCHIAAGQVQQEETVQSDSTVVLLRGKLKNRIGFLNTGMKEYWWKAAHSQGPREELMTNGYVEEWAISPQYKNASRTFNEGLAAVELNGKLGFIDERNRFIILPQFDPVKFPKTFRNGMAVIMKDGKYGYIDKQGKIVIEPMFEEAENFDDNHIAFVKMDGKYGAIDLKGDTLIPCIHTTPQSMTIAKSAARWHETDSLVRTRIAAGYYNQVLRQIKAAESAADQKILNPAFRNSIHTDVVVKDSAGTYGLYRKGQWILEPAFESVRPLGRGYYEITREGYKGVCDFFGRIIIGCSYDEIRFQKNEEVFIVRNAVGWYGLYGTKGNMILPPCLHTIDDFSLGTAICSIGSTYGIIDTHGQIVDPEFFMNAINNTVEGDGNKFSILRQIILLKPDLAQAHNNLGVCYTNMEDYKKGLPMLRLAHRLDPNDEVITSNIALAKASRKERNLERTKMAFTIIGTVAAVALTVVGITNAIENDMEFDGSSYSSGESYDSGSSSGGSGFDYQAAYDRWERVAKGHYESLTLLGGSHTDKSGNHSGSAGQGMSGSNYVSMKKNLRDAQREMKHLRMEASSKGIKIQQSKWETATVSY